MEGPASSGPDLRKMRLLWLSFVWSLGVYLIVLLAVHPAPRQVPPALWMALAAAALGCAVAAALVRRSAMAAVSAPLPDPGRRRPLDIATFALLEAIAVFGLVIGFLGGGMPYFLPFLAASFVGMLLVFPRASDYPEPPPPF